MASVAMLIHLNTGLVPFLYALNHENPVTTIIAFCKIRFYAGQLCAMTYRWCLVLACFDRYALSSIHARLRNFAKVQVARRVVLLVVLAWIILPMHILIFFSLRSGQCGPVHSAVAMYHSIFTIISGNILPVSLLTICSILIYRNLAQKRKRRHFNTNQQEEENQAEYTQRRRDQQVLAMLFVQILVYIVTQTPWMILNFYILATINVTNKTIDRISTERFISFLAEIMLYLFGVSSFYVHTLTSQTFRRAFVRLLCFGKNGKCFKNNRRIGPLTNNTTLSRSAEQIPISKTIQKRLTARGFMSSRSVENDQPRPINQQQETIQQEESIAQGLRR